MKRLHSLLLMATLVWNSTGVVGQNEVRRVYPQPRLTPEVARLQQQRVTWKAGRQLRMALPAAVDNSRAPYFPPVINQQGGSCAQASGIGYLFTYEMNRLLGRAASKSENRFSYLFSWNFLNNGRDEGGFVDEGLFLAERYGMMTEADYGAASTYQFKWATGYEKYRNATRYKAKETLVFPAVTEQDLQAVKRYLYDAGDGSRTGGIVTFSTQSGNWKMTDYEGPSETGYHTLLTALATTGAHALTIAGYDDRVAYTDSEGTVHYGAFIVVNTWGSHMHDEGRFYLPYYFFLHRDKLPAGAVLGTGLTGVRVGTTEPQVVYKVCVDYSSRNDLSVNYGSAQQRDAVRPDASYRLAIMRNQGGDAAMQGAWNGRGEMEFAIDCTDPSLTGGERPARYFLNIVRSGRGSVTGEGYLKAFSVIDYRGAEPREYVCKLSGEPLKMGENLFSIPMVPRYVVSASPLRGRPSPATYLLRRADGRYVKVQLVKEADGGARLRYALLSH